MAHFEESIALPVAADATLYAYGGRGIYRQCSPAAANLLIWSDFDLQTELVPYGPGYSSRLLTLVGADIVDLATNQILLADATPQLPVGDLNGDGFRDLLGKVEPRHDGTLAVFLSDGPDAFRFDDRFVTYRDTYTAHLLPLHDLDADGHDDILYSDFQDPVSFGYYVRYYGSKLSFHPGTVDGIAEQPAWTLDVDRVVLQAITLQMDDDPEREILALAAAYTNTLTDEYDFLELVQVDFDTDGQPFFRFLQFIYGVSNGEPSRLLPVGDIDGDGRDEVLFTGMTVTRLPDISTATRIYSASNDWSEPLVTLWPTEENYPYEYPQVITADLNDDGRLDVAMTRTNRDAAQRGTVQIWWAPFLEPDDNPVTIPYDPNDCIPPDLTTPTADTGTDPATTPPTTPTATTPDPQSTRAAEPSGCGCAHTSPHAAWALLTLFAWRRRTNR